VHNNFNRIVSGYKKFKSEHASGASSVMKNLSEYGQNPEMMIVACCDSRVDPALILQCSPGDLFVVRNVANIIPPYEKDEKHHGTSAALEFGLCFLNIGHLVILGHSQCGGIQALFDSKKDCNDFIAPWMSLIQPAKESSVDALSKNAIHQSFQNCLTFPWIFEKYKNKTLQIHRWFFDIKNAKLLSWCDKEKDYIDLF
jgi:carbonic anhydrase